MICSSKLYGVDNNDSTTPTRGLKECGSIQDLLYNYTHANHVDHFNIMDTIEPFENFEDVTVIIST